MNANLNQIDKKDQIYRELEKSIEGYLEEFGAIQSVNIVGIIRDWFEKKAQELPDTEAFETEQEREENEQLYTDFDTAAMQLEAVMQGLDLNYDFKFNHRNSQEQRRYVLGNFKFSANRIGR